MAKAKFKKAKKFGAVTKSGDYMACLIGERWYFCPNDHDYLSFNGADYSPKNFATEGEALAAAEKWEARTVDDEK